MGQKMAPIRIEIQDEKSVPRWYTIVTKFNYEQKFATDLEKGIVNNNITNIQEIFVPFLEEKVDKKLADGKIKTVIKYHKIYPGYVFVKAIMTKDIWAFIRKTSGFATILATGSTPSTMTDIEIQKIKNACGKGNNHTVGDQVEIINNVFEGNSGIIININDITNISTVKLNNGLTVKISNNDIIRR